MTLEQGAPVESADF